MTALPAPRLLDQFGRVGRDLRVSVTDRCNLRCTYCMPAEGLDWMPKPEMLSDDELVRVRVELPPLMTQVAKLRVPLAVEVGVGANWDKAH